jgi:mono/diheme cytochrome c family protein
MQGASSKKSAWDGVFTEAQAERGKVAYEKSCSECHGDDLRGVEEVRSPALVGQRFELVWDHTTVGDLFARISNTMPQSDPGSLDRDEYLDIVAFLLRSNAFPASRQELRGEFTDLQSIELTVRKK